MLIWVLHESGNRELLVLAAPFAAVVGKHLDRLVSGDGVEYWFTKDGYYDGWGRVVDTDDDHAVDRLIDGIEQARHVEESAAGDTP